MSSPTSPALQPTSAPAAPMQFTEVKEAVRAYRSTPACIGWQSDRFVSTLHVLLLPPIELAFVTARQLLALTPPPELEQPHIAPLIARYVDEVGFGAQMRRRFIPRLLEQNRGSLGRVGGELPMALPLLAEFEVALTPIDATLRSLFLRELQFVMPTPRARAHSRLV
ncbi:MAG: hypothetical protein EOO40_08555 [Deltaproteobacteria bacterium]|nr:MAG: hypothetical protein EOO40_08555 [Deltaproteobacteria bacterium]